MGSWQAQCKGVRAQGLGVCNTNAQMKGDRMNLLETNTMLGNLVSGVADLLEG